MRYISTRRTAFQLSECGCMQEFSPHLEVLPAAQSRLWGELSEVPEEFVLYGVTALALHLGHRNSLDFDFFGKDALSLPNSKLQSRFWSERKLFSAKKTH